MFDHSANVYVGTSLCNFSRKNYSNLDVYEWNWLNTININPKFIFHNWTNNSIYKLTSCIKWRGKKAMSLRIHSYCNYSCCYYSWCCLMLKKRGPQKNFGHWGLHCKNYSMTFNNVWELSRQSKMWPNCHSSTNHVVLLELFVLSGISQHCKQYLIYCAAVIGDLVCCCCKY